MLDTAHRAEHDRAVFHIETFVMTTTLLRATLALSCAIALSTPATAHRASPASEISALSMLPVAVAVTAPALLLSGTTVLAVHAVQASAEGTVWVLERASDGARFSVQLSGRAAEGALVASGTALVVTAVAAGWVLSAAGQAVAFVPSAIGRTLTHHERVTR